MIVARFPALMPMLPAVVWQNTSTRSRPGGVFMNDRTYAGRALRGSTRNLISLSGYSLVWPVEVGVLDDSHDRSARSARVRSLLHDVINDRGPGAKMWIPTMLRNTTYNLPGEQTMDSSLPPAALAGPIIHVGGGHVVSGSQDGTLKVWRLVTGEELHTLTGHAGPILACAVIADFVVSASQDGTLKVWQLFTGQALHTFAGHTAPVVACAVSGDRVVSASQDGAVKVWDLVTGATLQTLSLPLDR
jgi:WD40 repeat protein